MCSTLIRILLEELRFWFCAFGGKYFVAVEENVNRHEDQFDCIRGRPLNFHFKEPFQFSKRDLTIATFSMDP